jgi:outer membrane protein OmpA-like peptidoglycan-associated protein
MKKIVLFLLLVPVAFVFAERAERFEYQYVVGTRYRILSEVDANVYINDVLSHNARLLNKISVEIVGAENGNGVIFATLEMSEKGTSAENTHLVYEITERYEATFQQDRLGNKTVSRESFIPTVRNIPVFPNHELRPGDTWIGEGAEVHDFRRSFNISLPYGFPVPVEYQYLGKDETGQFDLISIKYSVDHRAVFPQEHRPAHMHLVKITGATNQIMKWDNNRGRPFSYSEEFNFVFEFLSGDTMRFVGRAKAEVIDAEDLDRERIVEEIRDLGIDVEKVAEGIKIIIEDIRFLPDSTILADREDEKLTKIVEIIRATPNHDLLIIGHTALAGTEEGRRVLSTQRARAVAEHILASGARAEREIKIEGRGAEEPIATNATAEGRQRNRRVEIIILEN